MSQEDKLKAIISKAVEGGWDEASMPWKLSFNELLEEGIYSYIFSHSFAKAIFGQEEVNANDYLEELGKVEDMNPYRIGLWLPKFEVHLQQAVISPNPIDYVYGNMSQNK